jgi:cytochrome b561
VAGIVAVQYAMQDWLLDAMSRVSSGENVSFFDFLLSNVHMLLGFGVGYLVFLRLKLRRQALNLPSGSGALISLDKAALWVHRLIYAVLISMVVSGALHYYAGLSFAETAHQWGKWVLAVLIALHLVGAAQHYWRRRA